jgi:predicted protein tyrosine phosphatase
VTLKDAAMIHVCPLARLAETVEETGARHVVSLIGDEMRLERPACISPENHLWIRMHDISTPLDGYILPDEEHITGLLGFVRDWDRRTPLVMHCFAGISRSTASAYASVCALNPKRDEASIARALRQASPTAAASWPRRRSHSGSIWGERRYSWIAGRSAGRILATGVAVGRAEGVSVSCVRGLRWVKSQ